MEIRPLSQSSLEEIIDCLLEAFSTYALKMPADLDYWAWRFNAARVDFAMSFGAFDNNKMVGFIIIGIDEIEGIKTAFNTGTGVIETHRGQRLIDQLYEYGFPIWKSADVSRCSLEVLTSNDIAIRVYERIGFHKTRTLHCYKKDLDKIKNDVVVEQMDIDIMLNIPHIDQSMYSWDFTNKALKRSPGSIRAHAVINAENKMFGYFSTNESHKSICQLELIEEDSVQDWKALLGGLNKIWDGTIKLNNVDHGRLELIKALSELDWDNHVNQFEMQMDI